VEVKPILLDTNAYAAFKRGDPEAVAIVQQAPAMALNTIVLGELFGGFALGSREEENRRELVQFLSSTRVVVLPLDRITAEHYAAVFSALKKIADPIPTNDIWIAASTIQHGFALFTYDRHFRVLTGLRIGSSLVELESA
jgi:predicted nucleic acid-binding protein